MKILVKQKLVAVEALVLVLRVCNFDLKGSRYQSVLCFFWLIRHQFQKIPLQDSVGIIHEYYEFYN